MNQDGMNESVFFVYDILYKGQEWIPHQVRDDILSLVDSSIKPE